MSPFLPTVFVADAHLADGEEPAVNKGKSKKFRVGTGMPTVSSKEQQNLKPL
jgi:hypothetical protein